MRAKSILTMIYTAIVIVLVFSFTITFMQKPFIEQTASLKFLFWETPAYSMIWFVISAGLIGLLAGLIIAVIDSFSKNRIISNLKKELKECKAKIEENESDNEE